MKTKPMLFSTPMVQALINDTKNQTRREILGKNPEMIALMINVLAGCEVEKNKAELMNYSRIQPGDVLWVREKFCYAPLTEETKPFYPELSDYIYFARYIEPETTEFKPWSRSLDFSDVPDTIKWKPSIHMPRAAARIFLKVTDVRIERLQDISEADAIKEGISVTKGFQLHKSPSLIFKELWNSINGLESWDINPLVWVISFEKTDKPDDLAP